MKSTLASFPSPKATGIGNDRAAIPNYDAETRPAVVPNDGFAMAYYDYDGPNELATVTASYNILTFLYLTASDRFSCELPPEMPLRLAANPINYVDL